MKRLLQHSIRSLHWLFCRRPLPERLGVYFHTLEPDERAAFAGAMRWIQSLGYRFVGPGEFLTASGRVCYVSFDDNFRAWHEALPFFAELGVRATFFINTCVLRGECSPEVMQDYCRTINYRRVFTPLARDEIRAMHDAGHWIGAHTHSHVALSRISRPAAMEDLGENKTILESITGSPVTDVAFPFGLPRFFSSEAREVCVALGFRTISWATPGMLFAQGDPLAIHRTQWDYTLHAGDNAKNLAVNGRLFVRLTGRSPVG